MKNYVPKLTIIIVLVILFSSCSKRNYSNKHTLTEKQEMYHKAKHPLKAKEITKFAFWIPTIFMFTFIYTTSIIK